MASVQPSQPDTVAPKRFAAPLLHAAAAQTAPAPARATIRVVEGGKGDLLTVRAVAARLGVSTATVYGLVGRGGLPHARVGNAIRVLPADLERFVAGNRASESAAPSRTGGGRRSREEP